VSAGGVSSWVSIEGLNGVGKTYLARRLATRFGGSCQLLSELTDHRAGLTRQVIAALTRPGATFLRTGHPITETFALLALKVYEYERLTRSAPVPPPLVLEDRGPDTVAVYQAAILTSAEQPSAAAAGELVRRITEAAAMWRRPPMWTLLLLDDIDTCIHRFTGRIGAPLEPADRDLLIRVDRLYRDLAAAEPGRIRLIHRSGRSEDDVLEEMYAFCRGVVREASAT
jgi:dTMP kinase